MKYRKSTKGKEHFFESIEPVLIVQSFYILNLKRPGFFFTHKIFIFKELMFLEDIL